MLTAELREQLEHFVTDWETPEDNRLDARVEAINLLAAIKVLHDVNWGYLAAITGLDLGDHLEVLYHFCRAEKTLTLRAHTADGVPSVCHLVPYASVFERELMEMFGVEVYGTPDPSRLFLPDDWPEDSYPLRKDATL
jgi:Ni,Fe-hydrogenase III component G